MKKLALLLVCVLLFLITANGCDSSQNKRKEFVLSDDKSYYIIQSMGTCVDSHITVPSEYRNKPVKEIGSSAFHYCYNLESITIPDSITSIGNEVFSRAFDLTSISVENGNPVYHSSGNCIIATESKTLVQGCGASLIPTDGSVTSIGDFAFCVPNLQSITIPDSVTSIGNYVFSGCSRLTSITIPDSVTTIGAGAFFCCNALTSITIPDSVTSIGEWAFAACQGLTSIFIPNSVTSIGDSAFSQCISLKDIYFTGAETEWMAITIGSDNDYLKNATIHFNSQN